MIEQKIKPIKDKLKITDVTIDLKNNGIDTAKFKELIAQNLPIVYYYGIQLQSNNIKKLIVDSNKYMPLCYVCYIDEQNIMHDIGFPADNAKMTVILPSSSEGLSNIFMDFKIQKYNVELMRNSNVKKIHIWGICSIDNLLVTEYKSYDKKSSYEIMSDIAHNTGCGMMSNVDSSLDKMTWINPGMHNYDFMQEVINKSWVGESGYIWGFVDLFYNINYIDIERSMSQDIKEIVWMQTNIFNISNLNKVDKTSDTMMTTPYLTNEVSQLGSNIYFTGEQVMNQSTDISLKRGYLRNVHFYDIDGNWEEKGGSYKQYNLDTITSSGVDNNSVYLKGEPGDLEFYKKNVTNHYLDKIDTSNMYGDYLWASIQNSENMYDLQKIAISIVLPIPNFNIRRFEKVKLVFFNSNQGVTNSAVNVKLNGEWLCTGQSFHWSGDSLIQKVNLVKRELTYGEV